ncbi:MAG: site-specific recombinase [Acidobacteriota bacterium]
MIAAIYCRKSNEQNDRDAADKSVTHQEERAREYIREKGWTLAEDQIFVDDGISGEEFAKRPGLLRLLRTVDQKPRPPFQGLVMADDSRLGREQIETAYVLKQIVDAEVRVFHYLTDKERTLDNPMDKIMLSLVGFADELKRVKDGQTVYDKVAAKAKRGYVVGCSTFGYDNLPVDGPSGKRSHVIRAINEAQAVVVRRIFAMSAAGMGYSRIADTLNREGAPAPKKKRVRDASGAFVPNPEKPEWSHSTVKVILDRRLYLGEATWNVRRKRDKRGKKIRGKGRKPERFRSETDWIRTAAPPIITEAEWRAAHDRIDAARERVQALRPEADGRRARDVDSKYLLSGFARCSECGGSLGVLSEGRGRRRVYGCSRARRGNRCSNHLQVPLERTDDAVLTAIIDQVLCDVVVEAIVNRVVGRLQPDAVSRTVGELRTALQGVEREIKNITTAIARGGELDSLLDKLRECEKRRADVRAAIENRHRVQGQQVDRAKLEANVRRRVEGWRDLLNRRPAQRREVLRQTLAGPITFTPSGRVYRFRGEASFGALVGEASVATYMVPLRGFEPRSRG